jgi:Flp pilus assembly protein TadB
VSKERARRRAEREAAQAAALAARARRERRLQRRRALMRRLRPKPGRRAWLLGRRHPGQRFALAVVGIGVLWLIWFLVDPLVLRIAFSLLFLLLLPVLAVVAFDRRV